MDDVQNKDEVLAQTPGALRDQALRRVKKRRDFHSHLFVFFIVNAVTWCLWAVTGAQTGSWHPWPLWITLLWGIGVIFNAWDVYGRRPITEQEIEREVERLAHRT
jgi:fatty acid desaturase